MSYDQSSYPEEEWDPSYLNEETRALLPSEGQTFVVRDRDGGIMYEGVVTKVKTGPDGVFTVWSERKKA